MWTDISRAFEHWADPTAHGPGLYFVVVNASILDCAVPMGSNRWPVGDCTSIFDDTRTLVETAHHVALSRDGAIVVHDDGRIDEAMVRLDQLDPTEAQEEALPYEGWMGARHMSALETATRDVVAGVVTLTRRTAA